jgi:plasmid stabilization system protein ParE
MSLRVKFRPEAMAELLEAVGWYEGKQAGLGGQFLRRVEEAVDRIASRPRLHAVVYKDVRSTIIRQFPYSVFYQIESDQVLIVAIYHGSRDVGGWQNRV